MFKICLKIFFKKEKPNKQLYSFKGCMIKRSHAQTLVDIDLIFYYITSLNATCR